MTQEYSDLTVTIHLSHPDAVRLREFISAYGDEDPDPILAAIRTAIRNAEKERERQDNSVRTR